MSEAIEAKEASSGMSSIPPSRPPSISPSLTALLAEGFLTRLSSGVIGFALPLFAYRKLGLNLTETGVLLAMNQAAEQLFKPLMGWAADRIGLKRAYTLAIAGRSFAALCYALAGSPWQIYSARFLHGISESLREPSVNALIAENAKAKSVASTFAWYNTAKQTASAIGKTASGFLLALLADNFSAVFYLAFALSILPIIVVALYVREPSVQYRDREEAAVLDQESTTGSTGHTGENNSDLPVPPRDPRGSNLNSSGVSIFSFAVLGFLISCTAQMIANLFPVLATEYAHLTEAQTGLIYAVTVAVVIVAGPAFGWFADNVSRKLALTVRGLANTISSVLFFFFPTFPGLAAGSVIDAAGKAAFRPAWGSLMARVSGFDRKRRAQVIGHLSMGEGLGEMLGPMLGGFLWHTWGLGVMLGARVVLAVIGEIYVVIIARKEE
ncbi:MAG: MFS transporter [Acidobacteriota bacterium]|nr:MFS transporter [Acidobacteriota bacterium]